MNPTGAVGPCGQDSLQLQVDHVSKTASQGRSEEVSRSACNGKMMKNLTSCLNDYDCFPFFPLNIVMAEQNLQSWSLDTSLPSPQIALFSEWSTFPFYWHLPLDYWLLSGKQPNLSSVTEGCCYHGYHCWGHTTLI